jgi:hypothetical protein
MKGRHLSLLLAGGASAVAPSAIASASIHHPAELRSPLPSVCYGVDHPAGFELWTGYGVAAREAVNNPDTCDGDRYYSGKVQDSLQDGSCAYVKYAYYGNDWSVQGTECTTGAWAGYSYTSPGGSFAYVQLATTYASYTVQSGGF